MPRQSQSIRPASFRGDSVAVVNRFDFERALLAEGARWVAGIDEAGRGPLAGPVVAAAVIFSNPRIQSGLSAAWQGLNDSKQLSRARREAYFDWLVGSAEVRYAVAVVDVDTIDSINILRATHRAMNQALAQLNPAPDHVLVDGLAVESIRSRQTALVKGDSRSYSIAAASVIAKVTRDRLMEDYDRVYPAYGFAGHKGYGTAAHLKALADCGPCPIHRRSFAPMRIRQPELF